MYGYCSFEIPETDGRLISGVFHIERQPHGALCGLVLDGEDRPACGVCAVLFEWDGAQERPVAHAFTDERGRFVFAPLKAGLRYTVRLWVGEGASGVDQPQTACIERDSPQAYAQYKELYEK